MGMDKVPINDRLIDNVPGAPPPEDPPNKEPIDPQQPDLTCTPDPTKTKAHRQVVGLENAGGTAYGRLATKRKPGLINISGVDWTTTESNHSNQQMPCESCSLNSTSGSAMIVGSKMTHISSEHYSTGISSNVYSSCWHISHFRHTSILNRCASLTLRVVESTVR